MWISGSTRTEKQKKGIFDGVLNILVALHGGERWTRVGDLDIVHGKIAPAQVVAETFWRTGDLSLWPVDETVSTLNDAQPTCAQRLVAGGSRCPDKGQYSLAPLRWLSSEQPFNPV
ncbi:uncharacterized protein SPSK_08144 [Sporothrix schenckii 1099-18]|uniref:Uncharacterized protein n=1 Tax=Sporothrix schenckii 1099-18 TaxID=1397361 RepID=A0A0F2MDL8_SPOSC|nr:uncharacterized protein SPSK_08144 [Sporothrix schenckii 1099-18]KJR87737.1 hypothetical protein SPSK_08144 [Sporothrix schenckii 1099-18]